MRTAASYLSTNISVHDMLFVNSNVRVESSSTIGPLADQVFIYPSVDLAWQFSKLKPFFGSPVLTFGKLRIAYGEVGVEPPPFNTQSIYVSPNYSDSFGGSLSTDLFGAGSFTPSQDLGDPQLRPEIKKEYEIGTDLRFFDNKINLGIHTTTIRQKMFSLICLLQTHRGMMSYSLTPGKLRIKEWS